jgi:hypothetical protein
MDIFSNIVQGMYQAIGFVVVSTVFGILSWFAMKRFVIKQILEIWQTVKSKGFEVNVGSLDIKLDGKQKKK